MNHKLLLAASTFSLVLLQACGGGGGAGGTSLPLAATPTDASGQNSATPPSNENTGSVSAPFAPSANARYQLLGVGSQSWGVLSQSAQAVSGAMTRLNDVTLSGDSTVTKEIAGDANFAIGRWVVGTVTRPSGAETLTGTDNRAYHYLAFNNLSALPATGTAACDKGAFTVPSYVGGSSGVAANTGTATGSANLAFDSSGATVSGSINVMVGSANGNTSLNGTIGSTTATSVTGALLGNGAGAALQLGDHGDGAYLLGVGYTATLPDGSQYVGVAKFRCAS